ncbi:MAG: DUF898 domain-containing protein [Rhodobacteraceae bacterium]|nr:DUF898 domain-containing protein [Paracoccaceae bacterium]
MATASPDPLTTEFVGRRWPLLWLALRTGGLTVLTFGLYRFWMKTRLRRWYWSAIRPGGHPLEYVGDPFEKLLGFLIAVVFLAFYIGIVNLVLMFASFALFHGNVAAYALSFVGVMPLWFYARYRARRYVLARTRWRGLRFGLEPGAWGYAGRAMMHWLLTVFSLGLLLPRMTFALEKYRTDRTFFGTERFEQGGRWTMLYRAMRPLFVAAILLLVSITVFMTTNDPLPTILLGGLGGLLFVYGIVHYRVESLRLLTQEKRLSGVRLSLVASPMRVFWIMSIGYVLAVLSILLPGGILGYLVIALQFANEAPQASGIGLLRSLPHWVLITLSAMLYFSVFLIWSAVTHVFITLPTLRHYAQRLQVLHPQALSGIHQRPRDAAEQAEGFAEALDVGASL